MTKYQKFALINYINLEVERGEKKETDMSKEEPTVQENVEVVSTMSMVSFREIAGALTACTMNGQQIAEGMLGYLLGEEKITSDDIILAVERLKKNKG